MPLAVAGKKALETGVAPVLPIEKDEEVNGVMSKVPIQYLAEITSAKEKTTKGGDQFLETTLAVDAPGFDRVYVRDAFFYRQDALWKLSNLCKMLEINTDSVEETDFIGQFVVVTLTTTSFTRQDQEVTENRIRAYIRRPEPDEVNPGGKKPF